jgi:hypothetical protein
MLFDTFPRHSATICPNLIDFSRFVQWNKLGGALPVIVAEAGQPMICGKATRQVEPVCV